MVIGYIIVVVYLAAVSHCVHGGDKAFETKKSDSQRVNVIIPAKAAHA